MSTDFNTLLDKYALTTATGAVRGISPAGRSSGEASVVLRSGPASKIRLAHAIFRSGRSVGVLVRTMAELVEMRALVGLMEPEYTRAIREGHPIWQNGLVVLSPHPRDKYSKDALADRMASLYSLRRNKVTFSLIAADALLLRTPPVNIFEGRNIDLAKGMEIGLELVVEQLAEWGYSRAPMVGEHGEFAVRGDILDIFCPGCYHPVRFEFFGDFIEDIRFFDPVTQRSRTSLEEMTIIPCRPIVTDPALLVAPAKRWEELVSEGRLSENDLYELRKTLESRPERLFPGMYYEHPAALSQCLSDDVVMFLPGEADTENLLTELEAEWRDFLARQRDEGLNQPHGLVMRPLAETREWLRGTDRVYFEDLRVGVESKGLELPERVMNSYQDLFHHPADLERPWNRLVSAMKEWSVGKVEIGGPEHSSGPGGKPSGQVGKPFGSGVKPSGAGGADGPSARSGTAVLSFSSERSRAKFLALAGQDGITPRTGNPLAGPGLYALISYFRRGSYAQWANTLVLGEDVLQPRSERAHRPAVEAFKGLDRYDELNEGDLLVHRDYGVCAFGGLQRLNLGGVSNDFLLLRYAGNDRLYLPVDRLSLIQVFKAPDGIQPALDKLGGSLWVSSKEKARKAIEKIAEDLVEMYAYRKVAKGFRYGPVNEMYREFEATFGFEETPDQARAIEDVLADMEKPEPMDRLVCGDVGFGKTEVALRACFRAAMEGRQVALLCPTTVLAEQHYQTFRSRLAGFPLNVGLLSRFVSKARQKEVLDGLKSGQVDIVIGTHRLLSKDVVIPNLGLIVLDEEQRFGVRHKELLKQMRKNVDVLTLTATPIPRTLQLSLSGIRELSVIETPPPERKPVATALIDRDEAALRGILQRELERQGQVFWVYNRVQGLERAAEYVRKLAPEARIGLAHGQMNEKELEETMRRFWHGELDILVCTAIIESGLDFPRANTLVVDQAQLFGLGQLYQLRGRVGRSDRQAFAVFVCPDVDRLPEVTRKRMRIILDMDYLGAGFQVAMEDLRLRGAGNILGESQSGHMQRLGLVMFLEMLEEAVAKMRGLPLRDEIVTELNLSVAAHIPETYIADSRERLRYYKALSSAPDEASQRDVEFELRDRFGKLPQEVENFLSVLALKRRLSAWGVQKADIHPDRLRLTFSEKHARLDQVKLVAWVSASKGRVKIHPPATLELMLAGGGFSDKLASAYEELLPICAGEA